MPLFYPLSVLFGKSTFLAQEVVNTRKGTMTLITMALEEESLTTVETEPGAKPCTHPHRIAE